jgi:hypothetical protein
MNLSPCLGRSNSRYLLSCLRCRTSGSYGDQPALGNAVTGVKRADAANLGVVMLHQRAKQCNIRIH